MGSRVVFYKYKALKEYDEIDVEPTAKLETIKIRRYHFKDEKFTHLAHIGRFDPDRLYEFPIAMLGGDCSFGSDFIAPSEGWMCEGDETKVEETHGLDGVNYEGSK
ncbi:hypothetical protein PIB30_088713 [Stylosanthes scabra]|uniref:Uncharacterized protein n=1 Tax=Stylosanthes scabra TaxID=79078 RepID=A0ABU6SUF2_9FABA|nr:hypothetical protein [Stylosanthes scabra]